MLLKVLSISVGGVVGSLLRYAVGGVVHRFSGSGFPYGTMAINLSGCLVIGLSWGIFERFELPPHFRLFLLIGVLGSYTTFSSFGLETFNLFRNNEFGLGIYNILLNNVLGISFVFAGYFTTRLLFNILK